MSEMKCVGDVDATMLGEMYLALEMLCRCKEFSGLVPEVRSNLVYAKEDAVSPKDVLGVKGRITVVEGWPQARDGVGPGASSHLARFILGVRKEYPEIRCALNFANDPRIVMFLREYSARKGWDLIEIDRSDEPEDIKGEEGASMNWKVGKVLSLADGRPPRVAYETGAVGKEPVTVLMGPDPLSVAKEGCEMARAFSTFMSGPVHLGKLAGD